MRCSDPNDTEASVAVVGPPGVDGPDGPPGVAVEDYDPGDITLFFDNALI